MIASRDRVELAPGVRLEGTLLVDSVRATAIRVNASAAVALAHPTCDRMAAALSARFGVDRRRAAADARVLCGALNDALLLNVRASAPILLARWLALALVLAPMRRLPRWPTRRYAVETASAVAAVTSVTRATIRVACVVGLLVATPFALIGAPAAGVAAGLAAALGLVLHEAAHAVALRGVQAAVVVRGVRVALLHTKLDARREAAIAAAGPVSVAIAAVAVLVAATALEASTVAVAAVVLVLHAVALTAFAHDGRKVCAVC